MKILPHPFWYTLSNTTFSSKKKRREERNQTGMVIGPRKNEMIGREGEKEQHKEVRQMMMTKTRVGIGEENSTKERKSEEAVTEAHS